MAGAMSCEPDVKERVSIALIKTGRTSRQVRDDLKAVGVQVSHRTVDYWFTMDTSPSLHHLDGLYRAYGEQFMRTVHPEVKPRTEAKIIQLTSRKIA